MKIWIDVLTPKQVLFFTGIAGELRIKGYNVFFTTRRFRETIGLAEKYLWRSFKTEVIGEYGGGLLKNKLISSLERSLKLTNYIYINDPDIAISFTSPDAARVAYGLGIPHISVSDTPHSEAVSRLTIPLSKKLYTPWIISKRRWTKYGIGKDRIFQYKGLDPLVWINRHKIDRETIEKCSLDNMDYIVVRPIESKASYQLNTNYRRIIRMNEWIPRFIRATKRKYKVIVIPRYRDQIIDIKHIFRKYRDTVIVLDYVVDGLTLLKYSNAFVGYGGTMTMEAALLGKPTISARPGRQPECIAYLIKEGLVKHVRSVRDVVKTLLEMMDGAEDLEEYAKQLREEMEDPAKYIAETIMENI